MFGSTLGKSLWAGRQAALTCDADVRRGEAAEIAVKMVGGAFDKMPIQRLLGRAVENLSLGEPGPEPNYRKVWEVLDDLDDTGINQVFNEGRRLWNLRNCPGVRK